VEHTENTPPPTQDYKDDDIQVEYHPASGRPINILKLDDYRKSASQADVVEESEPWAPFRTREDFEFAELMLDSNLSKGQIDALVKLFHKCIKGDGKFTISSHKNMSDTFNIASNRLTKV
jgi:hypothetical protein